MGAELITLFEESVIDVRHLGYGGRFTVGESPLADLPCAGLGEARELVRVGRDGIELVHADEVHVELLEPGAALSWTRELRHDRLVASVPAGQRARLSFGAVTMLVSTSSPPRRAALEPRLELRDHVATAGVAVLALVCLLMLRAIPPAAASLAIDDALLPARAARFTVAPPEAPRVVTAVAAPSGQMHTRPPARVVTATNQPGARTKAGAPRDAREAAELAASTAGVLGLLRESTHAGSLFGASSALGAGGDAVFGALTDDGAGCGGCAGRESSLSVVFTRGKPLDSIAGGPLVGPGHRGLQRDVADLRRSATPCLMHRDSGCEVDPPVVRVGDGPYDKATIRRVVRLHMNEFQFCYERELQRDESLSGRVVPRFTIEPNGRVVAATIESSTVGSSAIDACVVAVTRRLEFPKAPRPGLTIVSYPFVFKTAAQN